MSGCQVQPDDSISWLVLEERFSYRGTRWPISLVLTPGFHCVLLALREQGHVLPYVPAAAVCVCLSFRGDLEGIAVS